MYHKIIFLEEPFQAEVDYKIIQWQKIHLGSIH